MEPLLIHLQNLFFCGRNPNGDLALSFLSYFFSDFSDTSKRSPVLAPAAQLAYFQSFTEGWLYFWFGLLSLVQGVLLV